MRFPARSTTWILRTLSSTGLLFSSQMVGPGAANAAANGGKTSAQAMAVSLGRTSAGNPCK
ncbi:MAG TPA: hypothetical protein VGQ17_11530 [Gemmatimonadales bacterium]|nr:hypothetical protein [Gemmatimonadales bacterium]